MNETIYIKNAEELEREALLLIGTFYFEKNKYDFVASRKEIMGTGFHGVNYIEIEPSHIMMFNGVEEDTMPILKFEICVEWPGLLIGPKSVNINALTGYLASNFSNDYAENITVRLSIKEVDLSRLFFYEKLYHDDIECQKESPMEETTGKTSDGYHTFDELYMHRTNLFAVICRQNPGCSWVSDKHEDGSMFDGMFIAGITTPQGCYTYHCENEYIDLFKGVLVLDSAPTYDGHLPSDIGRLFSLLGN